MHKDLNDLLMKCKLYYTRENTTNITDEYTIYIAWPIEEENAAPGTPGTKHALAVAAIAKLIR